MAGEAHGFDDHEFWDKRVQELDEFGMFVEINEVWKYFKYCLQTQNKFFFENPLIPKIIEQFQNHVYIMQKDIRIYRARIDIDEKYEKQCLLVRDYITLKKSKPDDFFALENKKAAERIFNKVEFQDFLTRNAKGFEGFDAQGSGAPPYHAVSAGRCNPEKIVFLYAANDIHTATAEVRPFIRDAVSIATLSAKKDLQLLDFYYEYNDEGYREIDNLLFDMMRTEFSLLNKGNKEEYLITQYLSLLAQHLGFDGIRFRSSLVEQGENYVIFDADDCEVISSKMYIIKKVEYDLLPILTEDEKEVLHEHV